MNKSYVFSSCPPPHLWLLWQLPGPFLLTCLSVSLKARAPHLSLPKRALMGLGPSRMGKEGVELCLSESEETPGPPLSPRSHWSDSL